MFDCLSDLLLAWATDLMIGNFFVITCPYLFDLNTVAYFSILRNSHSFKTIARIRETTQVLLDVYNFQGKLYVHPLKAWQRYSPTMFLPHMMDKDEFVPIMNSADASNLFSYLNQTGSKQQPREIWTIGIAYSCRQKMFWINKQDEDQKNKMIEQLSSRADRQGEENS